MTAVPRGRSHPYLVMIVGALALGLQAPPCGATTLLAPSAGARDSAMAGSTVAAPSDLMSAFFLNPAGLTLGDRRRVTVGSGIIFMNSEVRTPFGYEEEGDEVALAPSLGVAGPGAGNWHFGLGLFGSIGSKFSFPADPEHGVERDFFTELTVITIAPTVAYRLSPALAVGVQLTPLLGLLRNRVPTPQQHLRWRVTGPGVQGVLGVLYRVHPDLRLAATYKTPGKIYMDGSVGVAGDREHLGFDLDVPQQLIFGLAWHPIPNLTLTLFGRWSETSRFESSTFEFSETPELNFPFASESRDVWRFGGGLEYQVNEAVALRMGAARGEHALEPRAVTPLLYDLDDLLLGAGLGVEWGRWILDLMAGYPILTDRVISAAEATVFPGRYIGRGVSLYWQVTHRFD